MLALEQASSKIYGGKNRFGFERWQQSLTEVFLYGQNPPLPPKFQMNLIELSTICTLSRIYQYFQQSSSSPQNITLQNLLYAFQLHPYSSYLQVNQNEIVSSKEFNATIQSSQSDFPTHSQNPSVDDIIHSLQSTISNQHASKLIMRAMQCHTAHCIHTEKIFLPFAQT